VNAGAPLPRRGPLPWVGRRVTRAGRCTIWLVGGVVTGFLALLTTAVVIVTLLLCLVGVGLLLLGPLLRWCRWVAGLERRRLGALGYPIPSPYGALPTHWRQVWALARTDPSTRRDGLWLLIHGTYGLVLGLLPLELVSRAIEYLTLPLRWWANAEPTVVWGLVDVDTWSDAWLGMGLGAVLMAAWLVLPPHLLRAQSLPGRHFLAPHPDIDLSARVAQLTASRAAALDAHAVELRRIERALHDGAQNRLVTTAVLTGAARQALAGNPDNAEPLLERAQSSAELALAELRSVVRSILPPVLEADGLPGALSALASQCPVPTTVAVPDGLRCPIAVEAVAYYTVAEALTNVARHSDAPAATVQVELDESMLRVHVHDDGVGGAQWRDGSGLSGIRQRVHAQDGVMSLTSPGGGPTDVEVAIPCE